MDDNERYVNSPFPLTMVIARVIRDKKGEGQRCGAISEQPAAHEAALQAPHRIRTEASTENYLQPVQGKRGCDAAQILFLQGRGDNRGPPHTQPRAHADEHPVQDERFEPNEPPKREEPPRNAREARQPQVLVRQPLRIGCRTERGDDCLTHSRAGKPTAWRWAS